MKNRNRNLVVALALLALYTLNLQLTSVCAQGTAFTYQGQLQNNGSPASGTYNLTFTLFTNSTAGIAVAGPVTTNGVVITNGLFTLAIDFGSGVWNGQTNWLQIGVETNKASSFTALTPRQQLTPVPYAIFANTASNVLGTVLTEQLSGTLLPAQLPSAVVTNNEANVTLGNVTVGGNLNLAAPAAVYYGGNRLLIADNNFDFYAGPFAGNFTTTGTANTGLGFSALPYNGSGSFNAAVGAGALGSNTGGNNNAALGYEALYSNSSGSDNVANGYWALVSNTSGSDNTANGAQALYANSSGYDNTANGYQALYSNTIGVQNTANGDQALYFNTSGAGNTANGYQALFYNTSGGNNTANGDEALYSNTNGVNNTANGSLALGSNTSGGNNTANGYEALYANSSGTYNTANGVNALAANTDGFNNTANGANALAANTDGYNNTVDGANALEINDGHDNVAVGAASLTALTASSVINTAIGTFAFQQLTAGYNNIGIGYHAGYNVITGTNDIYIGNQGAGTGFSSTENNIIRIGTPGTQTQTFIAGTIQSPSVTTITITGGSDLAEPFSISAAGQPVSDGAVVVIDEANPGQLKLSDQPYDSHVAGVVSGANGIHPGIQMHQQGLLDGGRNVALTGRVYVQADTSNGAIKPGDLLTTSSTPGHAMKVTDHTRAAGAILGKAMTGLSEDKGMVLVLVTLQ